jgi:FtsP/CotA-like multicopper oxidase with cupredoxin domain
MRRVTRIIIVAILVTVLAIGTVAILSYEGIIKLHPNSGSGKTDYFTIIEEDPCPNDCALAGMNGSYFKNPAGPPWPVMNVHIGDTVVITVINNKSSFEPHGFGIDHYLPAPGLTLSPGESHTITFVANEAGSFRVYCTIECSIHPLMQNGRLIVSS